MAICASSSASSAARLVLFLPWLLAGCGFLNGDPQAAALVRHADSVRQSVQREGRLELLEWHRPQPGESLRSGDLLITGPDSRIVLRFPASVLRPDWLEHVRTGRTLGYRAEGDEVLLEVPPHLLMPFGAGPGFPEGVEFEGRVHEVSGLVLAANSAEGFPSEKPIGLGREDTQATSRAPLPRGSFGFSVAAVGEETRLRLGLGAPARIQVETVLEGSPAQKAGLRGGDILLEVDGRPVSSAEDLARVLGAAPSAGAVGVEAFRWPLTFRVSMLRTDD